MTNLTNLAVVGCGHGELDKIYETIQQLEHIQEKKIDLVLICGDFQVLSYPLF
jgi:lariat debranching enzyme